MIWVFLICFIAVALFPWWSKPEKYSLAKAIEKARAEDTRRISVDGASYEPKVGEFIELPEGRVHYKLKCSPGQPLVVFMNGFTVPCGAWQQLTPKIHEAGFGTLCFDYWGRGFSDRPNIQQSRSSFVAQLHNLLRALGLASKPIHLVGLSMGGALTAAYAKDYPDHVRSVTLLAPLHEPIDIGPLKRPYIGEWLAYVSIIPSFVKAQDEDFVDLSRVAHWRYEYRQQLSIRGFRRAILSTLRHYLQSDPLPDLTSLKKLNIPRLLVWGEEDQTFPLIDSGKVLGYLGEGTQFALIELAGHGLQLERPDEVAEVLLGFWQELN